MNRSPQFERQWLEAMATSAGRWGEQTERFFDEIRERLDRGAGEYGDDAWATRPLPDTIREASEEGADIPAWLMLGAQKLNAELADRQLDPDATLRIQQRFIRAAALGMLAHEELQEAQREYKTARAEQRWREKVAA